MKQKKKNLYEIDQSGKIEDTHQDTVLYLLIRSVSSDSHIIIDKEYPGKESLIKLNVLRYDREQHITSGNINFGLVGKSSPAHTVAYLTYKKERKPSKRIQAQEIIRVIFPEKKIGYSNINGTEGS